MLLHVVLHPGGLPRARQTNHDDDLNEVGKRWCKHLKSQKKKPHWKFITNTRIQLRCADLTVALGLRAPGAPDPLINGDLLQEGEAFRLRKVRRLHLPKVELHSTVVADDVGEEGLVVQALLADLERSAGLAAVLGVGHHHLVSLKVLEEQTQKVGKHTEVGNG